MLEKRKSLSLLFTIINWENKNSIKLINNSMLSIFHITYNSEAYWNPINWKNQNSIKLTNNSMLSLFQIQLNLQIIQCYQYSMEQWSILKSNSTLSQ
jgi:hypothetical protein